jgi:hypothetical protein
MKSLSILFTTIILLSFTMASIHASISGDEIEITEEKTLDKLEFSHFAKACKDFKTSFGLVPFYSFNKVSCEFLETRFENKKLFALTAEQMTKFQEACTLDKELGKRTVLSTFNPERKHWSEPSHTENVNIKKGEAFLQFARSKYSRTRSGKRKQEALFIVCR